MRILLHDYSGHPCQLQLARSLAQRGHAVRHVYSQSFQTPQANLTRRQDDATAFEIVPVALPTPFEKHTFIRRRRQEIAFGRLVAREFVAFRPDVVISSNAPLDTQAQIADAAKRNQSRFVFWLQDLYSEGIRQVVGRRLPVIGGAVAAYYRRLEQGLLAAADHVIAITADFLPFVAAAGVQTSRASVVENWAPIEELPQLPRDNPSAQRHLPHGRLRVVYAGTLGHKHDWALLLDAAVNIDGEVVVLSVGPVADRLAYEAKARGIGNLSVRPWVPFPDLPGLLAGADIVVAMIEESAGSYSVPSKVLAYMATGRPILAAIPHHNLAGRLIERESAGIAVDPADRPAFLSALATMSRDEKLRERLGRNGRAYAERAFRIGPITDRVETILRSVAMAR